MVYIEKGFLGSHGWNILHRIKESSDMIDQISAKDSFPVER